MTLIVITSHHSNSEESKIITNLFVNGLQTLHVRKANATNKKISRFIKSIPEEFRDRLVLHSNHELALKYNVKGIHLTRAHKKNKIWTWFKIKYLLWRKPDLVITTSMHSVTDLKKFEYAYNYVFLSPVFDSISKKGYITPFSEIQLKKSLETSKYKVIALGGVKDENVMKAYNMGFSGIALAGYIWDHQTPIEAFVKVKEIVEGTSGYSKFGIVKPIQIKMKNK